VCWRMKKKDKNQIRLLAGAISYVKKNGELLELQQLPCGVFGQVTASALKDAPLLHKQMQTKKLFFYRIAQYSVQKFPSADKCERYENGLGLIVKKKGIYYLERKISLRKFDGIATHNGPFIDLMNFYEQDYVLVSCYIPEKYNESLILPHSVLCSIEPFIPSPVHLEEKTLLGRLDGRVQSIDSDELREIMGPLVITKNGVDQEGSLRWNSNQKCFEGFDGSKWRKMRWDDDNS
jgi:hypothetical protein